jgi:acyl transferase domain-containing protein
MGDVQANDSQKGIVTIGMSGRYPKARNLEVFQLRRENG